MMKKQHVNLNDIDREFLENLISQGELTAKAYRRGVWFIFLKITLLADVCCQNHQFSLSNATK
jgi:hypothetical protein